MISAITIELFDEKELLDIINLAICLNTSFIRKVRVYIVFLRGFEWVKMRLISRYNINCIISYLY